MKQREILTYPLSKEQFWVEFRNFVKYFQAEEVPEVTVLFGFAWGIDYYPGNEWTPEVISLPQLEAKILHLEHCGFGEFGYNDVFIEVGDVEFRFCNDTDVHIGFDSHQSLIDDFYSRWETMGYRPAEWLKNQKNGPGTLVRGGGPDV